MDIVGIFGWTISRESWHWRTKDYVGWSYATILLPGLHDETLVVIIIIDMTLVGNGHVCVFIYI